MDCLEGAFCNIRCYSNDGSLCTIVISAGIPASVSYNNGKFYGLNLTPAKRQHAANYTVDCPRGSRRTILLHVLCKSTLSILFLKYTFRDRYFCKF